MYATVCKTLRLDARRAAVAIAALVLGGCADVGGADITSVASGGLSALIGAPPPEQRNEEIELRARSPLVIPPEYNLRPPVNPVEEEQQLGAAWPEDPDMKAKEVAALEAARAEAEYEKLKKKREGRSTPLTPEELSARMVLSSQEPRGPQVSAGRLARVDDASAVPPDELLYRHRARQQAGQQVQQVQQADAAPQPIDRQVAVNRQATGNVQYQTQEAVEQPAQPAPPPPPEKKGLWDRLVFWD